MTTDITELAQSLKAAITEATPGGWYVDCDFDVCTEGCGFIAETHGNNLVHNAQYIALANPANVRALVEALEKAQAQSSKWLEAYHKAVSIGARYEERIAELESFRIAYMEWSDKTDWVRTDRRFDVVKPLGKHIADVLKSYIEHLESRTVKLPKPHAHLIWIQAGHAPDDYWDDVAVSHSEKDRCCDGSERYPVYARWEIEEMLTAAGIKWEAE